MSRRSLGTRTTSCRAGSKRTVTPLAEPSKRTHPPDSRGETGPPSAVVTSTPSARRPTTQGSGTGAARSRLRTVSAIAGGNSQMGASSATAMIVNKRTKSTRASGANENEPCLIHLTVRWTPRISRPSTTGVAIVTSYIVRWKVGGRRRKQRFKTRALADSFRAELLAAARRGEAFDIATATPVSVMQSRRDPNWLEFA